MWAGGHWKHATEQGIAPAFAAQSRVGAPYRLRLRALEERIDVLARHHPEASVVVLDVATDVLAQQQGVERCRIDRQRCWQGPERGCDREHQAQAQHEHMRL